MFRIITKLQKKPLPARRTFALVIAILVTAPIFALWALSLPFGGGGAQNLASPAASSPFSLIREEVENTYRDAKAQFQGAAELEYISSE